MGILEKSLENITLGEPVSYENMTLFPLLCEGSTESDYLTLDNAILEKKLSITEVSEQGNVPELLLTNDASKPVLLLDGEELIGAKQNRVINLTILAPAKQSIKIPVSCVEAGRWSHRSEEFAASKAVHYSSGRAEKMAQVSESLHHSRSRRSDQGAVWDNISMKAARMRSVSDTDAMSDIYHSYSTSVDAYCEAFMSSTDQVGAIFATNGALRGMEIFDSQTTLSHLLPKLIQSYALDALDTSMNEKHKSKIDHDVAKSLFTSITQLNNESFPAIGLGRDVRFVSDAFCGGALVNDDKLIHLCVFKMVKKSEGGHRNSRMRAASFRSRNRRTH
jgi:hypothetical protein